MSAIQQILLAGNGRPPYTGQESFITPGTFTWICPEGVTSVCAVAIGPGWNGVQINNQPYGGAGGGLGYKNNIPVVPGQSYTVVVGASNTTTGSYFGSSDTVSGNAAESAALAGGTFTGDGGGRGGTGGRPTTFNQSPDNYRYGGGGGSSGSYDGNGGAGGNGGSGSLNNVQVPGGTGGQGIRGGGGGFNNNPARGGGGGGAGANLYGGVGTALTVNGNNGRPGGAYGGGGGGGHVSYINAVVTPYANGVGGSGAVRIIWGEGRAFPSTNVEDI